MNETLKVLEARRSCRSFKADMVESEKIEAIVKAGTYAATGMGKQSHMDLHMMVMFGIYLSIQLRRLLAAIQ